MSKDIPVFNIAGTALGEKFRRHLEAEKELQASRNSLIVFMTRVRTIALKDLCCCAMVKGQTCARCSLVEALAEYDGLPMPSLPEDK